MMPRKKDPLEWDFRNYVQNKYSVIPKNDLQKNLDGLLELVEFSRDKSHNARVVLDQAARKIFRLFGFSEIAVGLKSPIDGLYRYEVFFGYSKQLEASYRQLKYTPEDMVDPEKFPFVKTGRISELDAAEGFVEGERHLYNRPLVADAPRRSLEDFTEADYMDFWMYDDSKNLIGWFELSKPADGKMPSCDTVRWVEVYVEVCSMIIQRKLRGA